MGQRHPGLLYGRAEGRGGEMLPSKARPSQGCAPKANEVLLKEGLAREHLPKRKKTQDVEKFTGKLL